MDRLVELNQAGSDFFHKGMNEPARVHFLAALLIEPNQPQVLQNLGATLRSLGHHEAALAMARRSVAASEGNVYCRSNLGVALLAVKQFTESLIVLKGVVEELPTSGPSWHNLGLAYYMVGQYSEALEAFNAAITFGHTPPQVESDRSLTLLSLGRLQDGLANYEVRWEIFGKKNAIWHSGVPEWKGEDLRGQRLVIHHEQGFGDSLMLVRFAHQLARRGCHLTIAVPKELVRLFKRSFPFTTVVDFEAEILENPIAFDYHSPMLSVMRWLGYEDPFAISAKPYLHSNSKFAINLPKTKKRIGICWASGNHGPVLAERRRLVPLNLFLPLLSNLDVSLISLQKGKESDDISHEGLESIIYDVGHKIEDFADTADIIEKLDLVITVDSAVAHLAGGLGKPFIMLGPYTRCWRWWGASSGQPWYNNMDHLQQSADGTWNNAVDEAIDLANRYMA